MSRVHELQQEVREPIEIGQSSQAARVSKEMARDHQRSTCQRSSIASPSSVAHVMVQKYQQSMPTLPAGTGMKRDWHPAFACNAGQLSHPACRTLRSSGIQSTSTTSCHGTRPSSKAENEFSKLHCSRSGAFLICISAVMKR